MQWPPPLCDPFRRMIASDGLLERLDWILGPHARLDNDRGLLVSAPGTSGHSLHSGPRSEQPAGGAPFQLGYNDSVLIFCILFSNSPGFIQE